MYQFHTGFMYSNSLTAHEDLVSGSPVALNADGELAIAADNAAIDGVVTTTVSSGDYVGLQTAGFCSTNRVDGTAGGATLGPIDFADQLEVDSGLFIKIAAGTAVAKSWGMCSTSLVASTTTMLPIEIL